MAIHRVTTATNDSYLGSAGLSEDQLSATFSVLSNDPLGASLYSINASATSIVGGAAALRPKTITIVDNGITYTGVVSVASNGRVNVDFSQSAAAINALDSNDILTGSFYYVAKLSNGKLSTAKVTFSIRGIDDSASITGNANGSVAEDGTLTAGGTLTVTDQDAGENRFQTPGSLAGTYGTFTFNAVTGVWGYTLSNGASNVQSLDSGDTVQDTLTVTSLDGSDSQVITVTINGEDDGAAITGPSTGTVAEDGTLTAGGTLTVTDVDAGESVFQTPGSLAGTYGTFTFNAATGVWGYTLNNTAANVQELITGQSVTDTLTVTSLDGSYSQTITVTIDGEDDDAAITGTATGAVAEDGALTAGSTLTVSDVDANEDAFEVPASLAGTYGDFTFNAATGAWGYTLDNTAVNVQALISSDEVEDILTVTSIDGSATQDIIVTITGEDDPAVIAGVDTGEVTEDGLLSTSGTLTISDPDAFEEAFVAPGSLAGLYGTFTFDDTSGDWTYTIVDNDPAFDSLDDEQILQDTLDVFSIDGTMHTITVTIIGTNELKIA
jgi:VCBS repeat-containing protein